MVPPDATNVSEIHGDLDGDGVNDRFVLYQAADMSWQVAARTSNATLNGRLDTAALDGPDPSILGVADADSDNDDEIFIQVHSGASTFFVQIWLIVESELTSALDQARQTITFPIAGSVTHGIGLACRSAGGRAQIRTYGLALNSDQTKYRWTEVIYEWEGALLRRVDERSGTFPVDKESPPRFYSLRCGDVSA